MTQPQDDAGRAERIRARLEHALPAQSIELIDDGWRHAGHANAGRGHFRLLIVSALFDGQRPLQRHQMVYRALGELLSTDIHALSITALTPQEAQHASGAP